MKQEITHRMGSAPTAITDDPPPSGVATERVPTQTLQVIKELLGERGVLFLALVLRQAIVKQFALPGLDEKAPHTAIIQVQSLRMLAKEIQWNYDTVEKYVAVFRALLLFRYSRRRGSGIELHFDLAPYTPPDPTVLDQLAGYRAKVASFVRKVKKRYARLTIQVRATSPSPPTPARPVLDIPGAMQDIRQLLAETGNFSQPGELLSKIEATLRTRCQLVVTETIDDSRVIHSGNQTRDAQAEESPIQEQTGDSSSFDRSGKRQLSPQTGNSLEVSSSLATRKGRFYGKKGDFSLNQKSPIHPQTGDSLAGTQHGNGQPLAQTGDFSSAHSPSNRRLSEKSGQNHGQTGDFSAQKRKEASSNVNVSLKEIFNVLNVNVGAVVRHLGTTFQENQSRWGFYHHLYKQGYQNSEYWMAAMIGTLQAIQGGQAHAVKKPGAYFFQLCQTFHQQESLSPEMADLVQRYGDLTHQQLLNVLAPPSASSGPRKMSPPVTWQPSGQRWQWQLHIPRHQELPGMDIPALEQVECLLRAHRLTAGILMRRYRQTDGSWSLLLDDGLTKSHQRRIYSLQECQQVLARIQCTQDLFREVG